MVDRSQDIGITNAQLEDIRARLMDYYGTASFAASPFACANLIQVEGMSPQELVDEALRLGIIHIQ